MTGGSSGAPSTQAIPTGWRRRVDPRPALARVQASSIAILQIVVAATAAYSFSHYVLGHPAPLLTATVTVGSLGLVRDARPRGVLETVLGMLLGIVVAELLFLATGSGWWQIALALAVTLVIARFVSDKAGFAIAAAIQSLIVMVVPSPVPFVRLYDGLVGGVAALLVTALIPRNPLKAELRDARALFAAFDATTTALVQALRRGDRFRAERGLEKARALTPLVENWRSSVESGVAVARISPFLQRRRSELQRHDRVRTAMDLAVRNLRVIGRRVVYVCDDGTPRPVPADLLGEIARAAGVVAASLDDISLEPAAREALRAVAGRLDPAAVLPDASLGDHNLVAALRPLVVDLLTATGLDSAQARKEIPRI
ncbi:aromatic acid exporter family protein [Microbacterium sp. B2969]|uniref:Aromatic acid exporter family protein n=1 Tax=Microbacterium alkaliflavum TaxID=3248839 RepID=A0ABW7Q401_9MICO